MFSSRTIIRKCVTLAALQLWTPIYSEIASILCIPFHHSPVMISQAFYRVLQEAWGQD